MTMFRILLTNLILLSVPALASDWVSDADNSRLEFTATQQGSEFDGHFPQFQAQIRFDPTALDDSTFDVRIEVTGIDTDNTERDETLAERDWFDFGSHPISRYRALVFEDLGEGRFRALGELEIRGQRHAVPLEFSWENEGQTARLIGDAELNRLDFGVGAGEWSDDEMIGHIVKVHTELLLKPATP